MQKHHKQGLFLSARTLEVIRNHDWPGNVRQLQHCMERAVLLSDSMEIKPGDLFPDDPEKNPPMESKRPTLAELELITIRESIRRNGGNLSKVARELGVARSTLYNKMKNRGI